MGMSALLVMWPNSFVKFFIPILSLAFKWIWFQMTKLFLRKTNSNFEFWLSFVKQWPYLWYSFNFIY